MDLTDLPRTALAGALAPDTPPSPASHALAPLDDARRTRCEVWTRVMGYHRPTTSFNTGKQGEFMERRFFREPADVLR